MSVTACNFSPECTRAAWQAMHCRRRGFTLMEVLATLLLIGIVLPVIMQGISMATSAGGMAQRRTEAGALAESKLNELLATGGWQYNVSGDFNPDWPGYVWNAEVIPWPQSLGVSGSNTVQELDVHVAWGQHSPHETVTVSTLVYPNAISSGTSSGLPGGLP